MGSSCLAREGAAGLVCEYDLSEQTMTVMVDLLEQRNNAPTAAAAAYFNTMVGMAMVEMGRPVEARED